MTPKSSSNGKLHKLAAEILKRGPDRVLVSAEGEALSPMRARERGVVPSIIFIRADGWSLGAPEHFAKEAERLWVDEWIGFLKKPSREPKPYKKPAPKRSRA